VNTLSQDASVMVIFIVIVVSVFNLTVSIRECDEYDMTSHVEEEEEENEEVEGRRKKTKRNFDDYVFGMLL